MGKKINFVLPKIFSVFVVIVLLASLGSINAYGEEKDKIITVTTNSDINPFIRVGLHKRDFGSGGPFTIRGQMNVKEFRKTKADGHLFYNIADGRDPKQMTVWMNQITKKTDGWVEIVDYDGKYITFDNIDKVLLSGVFEPFGLFQMGSYYTKSVIAYKNFRILDAKGKVVYSWNTDPNLSELSNLKEAEGDTIFALTFGDGSADFIVSEDVTTVTTKKPIYEDETTTTSKSQKTNQPQTTPKSDPNNNPNNQQPDTPDPDIDPNNDFTANYEDQTTENHEYQPTGETHSQASSYEDNDKNTKSTKQQLEEDKKMGTGIKIAIVLGIIVVVAVIVLAILMATGKIPNIFKKQ